MRPTVSYLVASTFILAPARIGLGQEVTSSPAFLEATLRRQWAGIEQELKMRKIDEEALGQAQAFHKGEQAAPTALGDNGRVVFVFGTSVPKVICAPLRICDIELQQGEVVHDVHAGDTTRWDIQLAMSGITPHLVVKPRVASIETNIAIYTDRRVYHLELAAAPEDSMPFVAFDYPEVRKAQWKAMMAAAQGSSAGQPQGRPEGSNDYEIQANPGALRFNYEISKAGRWLARRRIDWAPTRVYDDHEKTIIEMPRKILSGELPILLVREGGKDKIVNYRSKGRHFVVDRIFTRAVLVKGVGRKQERVEIERVED